MQLGVYEDPFIYAFLYLVWRKGDFKLTNSDVSLKVMYAELHSRVKLIQCNYQTPHTYSLEHLVGARLSQKQHRRAMNLWL